MTITTVDESQRKAAKVARRSWSLLILLSTTV